MSRVCISFFIVFTFGCFTSINGQESITIANASSKDLKTYREAEEMIKLGNTDDGLESIDQLLNKRPQFIDAYLLKAQAFYSQGEIQNAIEAIHAAIAIDENYKPYNYYILSTLYAREMQYLDAIEALNKYTTLGDLDADNKIEIDELTVLYQFRDSLVQNPVDFDPVSVKGEINSAVDEALPAFTVDGNRMIFTRYEHAQEDLYTARWDSTNNAWIGVAPINGLNSEANEGAPSMSADGSVIAFTACGRKGGLGHCDIYIARRNKDGSWAAATNVEEINSEAWDGQPSLSPDGYGLFFSSERKGGFGKRDLWYAQYNEDGSWDTPVNCGDVLNTSGNDSSPFLSFDNSTLYFMSDGHRGLGDYDIFISHLIKGSWSTPVNLGYPVNTSGREGGLSVHPNAIDAFYTLEEEIGGRMDISTFVLPENARPHKVSYVRGLVIDQVTQSPVSSEITVYSLEDSNDVSHYFTDRVGRFMSSLKHGEEYGLHVEAEGYIFHSSHFALDEGDPFSRHELIIELSPASSVDETVFETMVTLSNIQFRSGDSVLLESSETELSLVVEFLKANTGASIEIQGHTDNVGTPEDNQRLSEARARAVATWLIENGVASERLSTIGFGESRPIATNETEDGRRKNRRTEMVIR